MCRSLVFCAGAAWLALPACTTDEIGPRPITVVGATPGPEVGGLMVVFAPTADTFEEDQARALNNPNTTSYYVFVDGAQLAFDAIGRPPEPVLIYENGGFGAGFLPAGPHHFEVAAAGGPTLFAGDTEIPGGSEGRLFLYGHLDAIEGRFVWYPAEPAPGTLHVSVINLVKAGPAIEAVGCVDAARCTPLSPPLALGDAFAGEFPAAAPPTQSEPRYTLADGRWIGVRQVATAARPAPPVHQVMSGNSATPPQNVLMPAANLVVAPIYMSAAGNMQAYAN